MQRRFLLVTAPAVALAVNGFASAVHAQPTPADVEKLTPAQALYEEATKAMDAKDFAAACPKLEDALRLVPQGVGGRLTLAQCYEGAGKLASAYTNYALTETMAADAKRPDWQRQAHEKAEALRPKLAKLTITVAESLRSLPGLDIQRDGVAAGVTQWGVPIPVDKGRHVVTAGAAGKRAWDKTIDVTADGLSETVTIDALEDAPVTAALPTPEAPSPAPPSLAVAPLLATQPLRMQPFLVRHRASALTGGAAVVLAGFGVGLGAGTWSHYGALSHTCEGSCSPSAIDAVKTEAVATNVLLGVAGAAAVASVGLFVFVERERASVTIVPAHGGAQVMVHY